jgi:hypothetical protein
MGLFNSNTQLTDEERDQLEADIEKAKGVYRVYPRNAKPGESHWSDGSVSYFEGDATQYGCHPTPGLVPVRFGSSSTKYMKPEKAEEYLKKKNSFWGRLFG